MRAGLRARLGSAQRPAPVSPPRGTVPGRLRGGDAGTRLAVSGAGRQRGPGRAPRRRRGRSALPLLAPAGMLRPGRRTPGRRGERRQLSPSWSRAERAPRSTHRPHAAPRCAALHPNVLPRRAAPRRALPRPRCPRWRAPAPPPRPHWAAPPAHHGVPARRLGGHGVTQGGEEPQPQTGRVQLLDRSASPSPGCIPRVLHVSCIPPPVHALLSCKRPSCFPSTQLSSEQESLLLYRLLCLILCLHLSSHVRLHPFSMRERSGSLRPATQTEELWAPLVSPVATPLVVLSVPRGSWCWWTPWQGGPHTSRDARGWSGAWLPQGACGVKFPVLCTPGQEALPQPFPTWPLAARLGMDAMALSLS